MQVYGTLETYLSIECNEQLVNRKLACVCAAAIRTAARCDHRVKILYQSMRPVVIIECIRTARKTRKRHSDALHLCRYFMSRQPAASRWKFTSICATTVTITSR